MRQLLPTPADVDPVAAHRSISRTPPPDRPWVLLNMVASIDGATTLAGLSGGLADEADRAVFRALRAVPDAILAGAGTVRAERYGPPRTLAAAQRERTTAGQTPYPRLVVVTSRLDLDPELPLFTEPAGDGTVPLIITGSDADASVRRALDGRAEIVALDAAHPQVTAVLDVLHQRGCRTVLCEGGPALNAQLAEADLIDELNITLAPLLVGGTSARLTATTRDLDQQLTLAHLWEADGTLLARYVRRAR